MCQNATVMLRIIARARLKVMGTVAMFWRPWASM
jgi:hypothetical protein